MPIDMMTRITVGILCILFSLSLLAIIVIIRGNWNNKNLDLKLQIRAVGLGIIFTVPLIVLIGYVFPRHFGSFNYYCFAFILSIILFAIIYSMIIRHGLFDLRSVIVRAMSGILACILFVTLYISLAYILSLLFGISNAEEINLGIEPFGVLLALVVAPTFRPIVKWTNKIVGNIWYRKAYDQEAFTKEFNRILSYNTEIDIMVKSASNYIKDKLESSWVDIYIEGHGSVDKKNKTLGSKDLAKEYMNGVIFVDRLKKGKLRSELNHLKIRVIIPIYLSEKFIGCVLLGKREYDDYDMRDIQTVKSVVGELAIAIQNSLSVELIRDLNDNLQKKVDDATRELVKSNEKLKELDKTKDEFLSIASHQLRTPLTSIKGYVDMLREGDFGKVNEAQKEALDETFSSSERMVRLINDFLNISRLQTGKFIIDKNYTNISILVGEEVTMLDPVAKQSDITIDAKLDSNINANIDGEKIRQVVLNMIDNAIFYSKPGSVIKVRLRHDKDFIEFTVKDTGIGVPKEDQGRLFGKFFRAPNAQTRRPDGTGVGLFLSKKVLSGHKGEIIFSSEENKGSTFGFRLPL